MQTIKAPLGLMAMIAGLATACLNANAIESNFDDSVYPGAAGDGWVGGWQQPAAVIPTIQTATPLDGGTPYLNVSTVAGNGRNVARQYETGGGVNVEKPYLIRWKFRLNEVDFTSNFTVFNDRVHFFARNGLRLSNSTDASINWSVVATGAEQTTAPGLSAGQTFWIYD